MRRAGVEAPLVVSARWELDRRGRFEGEEGEGEADLRLREEGGEDVWFSCETSGDGV